MTLLLWLLEWAEGNESPEGEGNESPEGDLIHAFIYWCFDGEYKQMLVWYWEFCDM